MPALDMGLLSDKMVYCIHLLVLIFKMRRMAPNPSCVWHKSICINNMQHYSTIWKPNKKAHGSLQCFKFKPHVSLEFPWNHVKGKYDFMHHCAWQFTIAISSSAGQIHSISWFNCRQQLSRLLCDLGFTRTGTASFSESEKCSEKWNFLVDQNMYLRQFSLDFRI